MQATDLDPAESGFAETRSRSLDVAQQRRVISHGEGLDSILAFSGSILDHLFSSNDYLSLTTALIDVSSGSALNHGIGLSDLARLANIPGLNI